MCVKVVFKAIGFLINKSWFSEDLAEYSLGQERVRNPSSQDKNSLKKLNLDQRLVLIENLRKTFLRIFFVVLVAMIAKEYKFFKMDWEQFSQVVSLICFSFGTLFRIGFQERTCVGGAPLEILDEWIFWSLYLFGTFFGILSIF